MRSPLFERLEAYAQTDAYPLHMPGHKRNERFRVPFYRWDITEIDGFDNLHHAEEILKEIQENAARYFHSSETHFLINGSTAGILSALSGSVKRGGTVLAARNCHKAVYHAAYLRNLTCAYLYPEIIADPGINGGITPRTVEEELKKHPEAEAVILTSPTYEGLVSDIGSIAAITHRHGIPLIVDEAHGAHFGGEEHFPKSALFYGADVVVQSLHKTMPAPTQTAVLHINGPYADRERIRKFLEIYQTSSPSYLLMAAMDESVRIMQEEGEELLRELVRMTEYVREGSENLKHLVLPGKEWIGTHGVRDFDISRLLVCDRERRITGAEISQIFRERYHLEMEMAQEGYALAILTAGDTWEGLKRLKQAIWELDEELSARETKTEKKADQVLTQGMQRNRTVCTMTEAEESLQIPVPFEKAANRVSAEFFFLYPPGIPLAVPGELISLELCERVARYRREGFEIQGLKDKTGRTVRVLA